MTHPSQEPITQLLEELRKERSDRRAVLNALLPLVYDELHALAHRQRHGWHGDYTVNTTALIHEAYLKLVDQSRADWTSRAHFYAVAATAMRHILIDYAKRRRAEKRGGDRQKLSFDEVKALLDKENPRSEALAEVLEVLDEALQRLARFDERQSRVVECRFFGGMTIEETAAVLGVATATVNRDWRMARAWLSREIRQAMQE
jgi:RNA polymerase sigma factor (TIGR02999 family)